MIYVSDQHCSGVFVRFIFSAVRMNRIRRSVSRAFLSTHAIVFMPKQIAENGIVFFFNDLPTINGVCHFSRYKHILSPSPNGQSTIDTLNGGFTANDYIHLDV